MVTILLFFTALSALAAGGIFISDPSGQKMGMSTDYLKLSPFRSFLIPGILLFIINGILNLFAAILTLKNHYRANTLVTFQGVLLCGWIILQVLMVRDINPLHIIMFTIGVIFIVYGAVVDWRKSHSLV